MLVPPTRSLERPAQAREHRHIEGLLSSRTRLESRAEGPPVGFGGIPICQCNAAPRTFATEFAEADWPLPQRNDAQSERARVVLKTNLLAVVTGCDLANLSRRSSLLTEEELGRGNADEPLRRHRAS